MPFVYDLNQPIDFGIFNNNVYADTNVLADLYYDKRSLIKNTEQSKWEPYHQFISAYWSANLHLHIIPCILFEMFNVFLKYDMNVYNKEQKRGNKFNNPKDFREIEAFMQERKDRYNLIMKQIYTNELIKIAPVTITDFDVISYIDQLNLHSMDSNDYILTTTAKDNFILTDDRDYASQVVSSNLITGNPNLISKALSLGFSLGN